MSSVKSRREQYSEATRAALLDAATARFAEHGFAGTALEEVAADVQATRGAVYHHFANKTALFQAVYEQQETAMIREVAEASKNTADPVDAAYLALDVFLTHACDPVYGRIVWQEAPLALGWHRWRECEEQYAYGLIEQVIRSLMVSGDFEPIPFEPATRITFGVLGAAGMALADTPERDKQRVKGEYAAVIRRMLSGMRR